MTNAGRLLILDQLRGLCLTIIIVDHIGLFPSLFEVFTGRQALWVTAAEGFFFISGLLVGLIRRKQADRDGFGRALHKIWGRAAQLYAATVVLTLAYTGFAYFLNNANVQGSKNGLLYFGSFWSLLWQTATMQYSYGWSDFLPYYVMYLLIAPAALWVLRKGWWQLVLMVTVAGWLLPLVWPWVYPTGLRWQAYFFTGMVIGYHYLAIQAWWRGRPSKWRQRASWWTIGLAAAGLMLSAMITLWPVWWPSVYNPLWNLLRGIDGNETYRVLFQNNRTGILRLPFFFLVFSAFYVVFQRYQAFIMRRLNWLLEPLGRNSLYVYIMQGIVVFLVRLAALPPNLFLDTLVDALAIMGVWWLVKKRFLFKVVPK